jgi:hypothetical protein
LAPDSEDDKAYVEMTKGISPEMADPHSVYLLRHPKNHETALRIVVNRLMDLPATETHVSIRKLYISTSKPAYATELRHRIMHMLLDMVQALNGPDALRDPNVLNSLAESRFWLNRNIRPCMPSFPNTPAGQAWMGENDKTYNERNFTHQNWIEITEAVGLTNKTFHAHRPRPTRNERKS